MEYLILENKRLKGDNFKLTLEIPPGASLPVPGQFYNFRCGEGTDPLLRRPLSVHRITEMKKTFHLQILYRVVGRGTDWISNREKGQSLDTLGPLGNGFIVDPNEEDVALVAGGMGIAPLYAVGEYIRKANPGATISVIHGVRNGAENFYEEECRQFGEVFVATDDGSHGFKGTAVELLTHMLDKNRISGSASFFGCGPKVMFRELARISEIRGLSMQVTLEENMGCGFGACLSCALPLRPDRIRKNALWPKSFLQHDEKGSTVYSLVCKDGPVYDIKEVDWDEWLA